MTHRFPERTVSGDIEVPDTVLCPLRGGAFEVGCSYLASSSRWQRRDPCLEHRIGPADSSRSTRPPTPRIISPSSFTFNGCAFGENPEAPGDDPPRHLERIPIKGTAAGTGMMQRPLGFHDPGWCQGIRWFRVRLSRSGFRPSEVPALPGRGRSRHRGYPLAGNRNRIPATEPAQGWQAGLSEPRQLHSRRIRPGSCRSTHGCSGRTSGD